MLHHRIIGTGTPVVMLHGVTLDLCYMMDVMEPGFRGIGDWKRIYVDMPGQLGSAQAKMEIYFTNSYVLRWRAAAHHFRLWQNYVYFIFGNNRFPNWRDQSGVERQLNAHLAAIDEWF
jgi:pimeloyl-ACP methyl ester carboxylesterase